MGRRPSESDRRDAVEEFTRREIDHERAKGKNPDERKIRQEWEKVAIDTDKKRGWS